MTFKFRAALISAATLGAAGIAAATAPGLAGTPDDHVAPVLNTLTPAPVPSPIATPAPPADMQHDPAKLADAPVAAPTPLASVAPDADDDEDYATLAAAVADQSVSDDMDAELRCLATGVYFESKGEPLAGQLAVAKVILNRTRSGRFPRSVCGVLTQPHQFSFVRGGRWPAVASASRAWRTAVAVAKVARNDDWANPVPGALFFHARYVAPGWRMARVGSVGNHVFYR